MASWRERLGLSGLLDLARRARRAIGEAPTERGAGLRALLNRARAVRGASPIEEDPTSGPQEPAPAEPELEPQPESREPSDEDLLEEYEKELRRLKKLREQLERRGRSEQARQRQRRVEAQKPGRLVVDVSDDDGVLIEGATVEGRGPSGQEIAGKTDVDGRVSFAGIEPGPWHLVIRASGYEVGVVDVEVPSGRAVRVGVVLRAVAPPKPVRAGTLIVNAVDPSGRPIVAVSITVVGPSEQVLEAITDDNGQVVLPGLDPGNWRIVADAEDLEAQEATARIDPGKTTRVRLVMDFPPEDEPFEPKKETPSPWLRGSSIHIPFVDPEGAFLALIDVWQTARIGMRTDEDGPTKYNPNAYAKGSPVDPGLRIPGYALRSADAFERWAQQNGFGEGLSITIDGMVAAPGRSVISDASKLWTPED